MRPPVLLLVAALLLGGLACGEGRGTGSGEATPPPEAGVPESAPRRSAGPASAPATATPPERMGAGAQAESRPGDAAPRPDKMAACLRRRGLRPSPAENQGRTVRTFEAKSPDGNTVEVVVERPGVSGVARDLAASERKNRGADVVVSRDGNAFGSFRAAPSAGDARSLRACLRVR
jgi:hypothetical protein